MSEKIKDQVESLIAGTGGALRARRFKREKKTQWDIAGVRSAPERGTEEGADAGESDSILVQRRLIVPEMRCGFVRRTADRVGVGEAADQDEQDYRAPQFGLAARHEKRPSEE